jgi:hypothetical protein
VAQGIRGESPITSGQLTAEEIKRCEQDPRGKLSISERAKVHLDRKKKKTSRYTPVARRQDKPDAIAWLLKHCPVISDMQIIKLIGTTKTTIASVRTKSHWNTANIRPRDPVLLGLCTQVELDRVLELNRVFNPEEKNNSDSAKVDE